MASQLSISSEQSKVLSAMLERKHGGHLGNRFFVVETDQDGSTINLKVTLRDAKGTFVYPVEARMSLEDQDLTAAKARDFLIDYVDVYFDEYLSHGEDTFLPIDWSDFECDGFELQMRGQILNLHLEKMADDLIN